MIIALIVLSSILLILILGLIFNKDFRVDILKAGSDNQAEFKGVKIKGALFWVIYALTAMGTIYIAINIDQNKGGSCDPVLKAKKSQKWEAIDVIKQKPVDLNYGCPNNLKTRKRSQNDLNMQFDLTPNFKLTGKNSDFIFGELDKQSILDLGFTNDMAIDKYIEIYYDLQLSPFESTRRIDPLLYDWNEYANLPFTITVKYSSERQVHVLISGEKVPPKIQKPQSLAKWNKAFLIGGNYYIVRLRSRDANPNNNTPEFVNFQIFRLSCKANPV